MQQLLKSLYLLFLFVPVAIGQIPAVTHITILKAEDARRYDSALESLFKSPSEQIRVRAALAAGRIGKEDAVPVLIGLFEKDPSAKVREMAMFALGEIESIKAADLILRAIGETARAQIPGKTDLGRGRTCRSGR